MDNATMDSPIFPVVVKIFMENFKKKFSPSIRKKDHAQKN